MVMYTARLTRTRIAVMVGVVFALVLGVILAVSSMKSGVRETLGSPDAASVRGIASNEERIAFLQSWGWETRKDPIAIEEVVIPTEFDDVYTRYNDLQLYQGMDLSKYRGKTVKRYTYAVTNYPDGDEAHANLLIYKERIVGADVCSAEFEGFMHGLQRPGYADGED